MFIVLVALQTSLSVSSVFCGVEYCLHFDVLVMLGAAFSTASFSILKVTTLIPFYRLLRYAVSSMRGLRRRPLGTPLRRTFGVLLP